MVRKYWIHESCHGIGEADFDVYVSEARILAYRTAGRLQNPRDTDFARAYNLIHKAPKSDRAKFPAPYLWQVMNGFQHENQWKTIFNQTRADLTDFGTNWSWTPNRCEADVRIYSDGGRRWVPCRDGRYFDPVNKLFLNGDLRNLRQGQAFTSYTKPDRHDRVDDRDENPNRVTIDLCAAAWAGLSMRQPRPLSLKDLNLSIARNPNVYPINIGDVGEHLMTRIIFHEFMHCTAYGRDDCPDDFDGHTSGWEYCMELKKSQAAAGAESIAFLALIAGMADMRPAGRRWGGFTVDRRWDAIPGSFELPDEPDFDDEDVEGDREAMRELAEVRRRKRGNRKWDERYSGNMAVQGVLVFYEDLTN